jgi:hypothetical protein
VSIRWAHMIRALLIAFLLLHSVAVFYQAPASSSTLVLASGCVPTAPSQDQNGVTTGGKAGEPLGDKLARSDGTLCPPAGVDAQIRTAAPDASASKMPVIPPPGSVGGDASVRPK